MRSQVDDFKSRVSKLFDVELSANGYQRTVDNWYNIQSDILKHISLLDAIGNSLVVNVRIAFLRNIGNNFYDQSWPRIQGRWSTIDPVRFRSEMVEALFYFDDETDIDYVLEKARELIREMLLPFLDRFQSVTDLKKIPASHRDYDLNVGEYLS